MKLVVLAGGRGTRMGVVTTKLPKPMVRLGGKPILEHQIELAKRYGFTDIHVLTGHLGEVIEEYFGGGERWGVEIRYSRESEPLGTAGAVREISEHLNEEFLVFYGDVMMDVDLGAFSRFHHQQHDALASIAVHPNDHPYDSDLVEIGPDDRVTAIHSKPHSPGALHRNLVSAALYFLSPKLLQHVGRGTFSDFGKDIFRKLVLAGEDIRAYNTREYIKDIGTVQRLKEVEADLHSGRVARFNRSHALGAVFLDRDGVLNPDDEPLRTPEQMTLYPGVPGAVRSLNKSERLSVVVTNQPLIAKGIVSETDLANIHAKLETLLSGEGAYLDRIYHCPHHPEGGHPGERPEYKIECDCRKPRPGMIEQAVTDLNIDLADSFIVGDRTVDIMTGQNAGVTTILVRTGCAGTDGPIARDPDFVCDDLADAVRFVTERYAPLVAEAEKALVLALQGGHPRPMIVVAGLSRSGKSTFASVLGIVMGKRGIVSRRLHLDHWIVGLEQRHPGGTVRDRYRYLEIAEAVERLLHGEQIEFDRYDAARRGPDGRRVTLAVAEAEVLVVEGTVGLDLPALREMATLRVYVEVPESVRKTRFIAFYRHKGLDESTIESLYSEREISERPVILESRQFADRVINMESLL